LTTFLLNLTWLKKLAFSLALKKIISVPAFQYTSSSEEENVDDIISTNYLGANPHARDSETSEEESSEGEISEGEVNNVDMEDVQVSQQEEQEDEVNMSKRARMRDVSIKERRTVTEEWQVRPKVDKRKKEQQKEDGKFEVGEFMTALYEGKWLITQVDIDQDQAGDNHVNLNYMESIGENLFKWPKNHDLLLTLKEDILTRCSAPIPVGSTIGAHHVGLKASDAKAADAALAKVVYLQQPMDFHLNYLNFFIFYSRVFTSTHIIILG
jgi:hypothetical protein